MQRIIFRDTAHAINILTNDKVFKAGLRRKMRKAAMDRNYLASVLAGSGLS
ncbi:H repeat-associated yhhI domain protein [Escherichia coli p0305293.15]|nr:H repeat-associated yhhI domain protein [Escherichia coli p0305293.15]